jgi:pimeloyl-ACP methyl ester carboxylesterase
MPTAEHDGVSLVYDRIGPPDAPTVAFVSGLGYGRWMWHWQRERLESEYELIVWDNRGAGDSDAPEGPYSMSEMAGDLEAVLAAADRSSVHLVGASMGGMIAQQYALEYDRAASLSLLCTTHGGPAAEPIPDETKERMFSVPDDADERDGEDETLGHPRGVPPNRSSGGGRIQSDPVEEVVGVVRRVLQIDGILEVLVPREPIVESVIVGENPDPAVNRRGVRLRVVSEHGRRSGCRPDVVEEHIDGRGLAGAVRTEEPEDFPLLDGQVHVVDGEDIAAEPFRQSGGFDGSHALAPLRTVG